MSNYHQTVDVIFPGRDASRHNPVGNLRLRCTESFHDGLTPATSHVVHFSEVTRRMTHKQSLAARNYGFPPWSHIVPRHALPVVATKWSI